MVAGPMRLAFRGKVHPAHRSRLSGASPSALSMKCEERGAERRARCWCILHAIARSDPANRLYALFFAHSKRIIIVVDVTDMALRCHGPAIFLSFS